MIEFSHLSVLIFAELLLALAVLSGILITLWGMRTSRIRQAARHLVDRIQTDKTTRTQRLRERLAEHYRYEGESLEQSVHDLTQAEMRLYQNIINSYLKQDVVAFQQTDVDVENLVMAYQQLSLPEGSAEASGKLPVSPDESAEMKRLRDENKRLSDELGVTMDTMGRMLDEYSYMFTGGANRHQDKQQKQGSSQNDRQALAEAAKEPPESAEDLKSMGEVLSADDFPDDADELVGGASIPAQASVPDVRPAAAEQTAAQDGMEKTEAGESSDMKVQVEGPGDADAETADLDDSLMEELEQIDFDILEPQQAPEAKPVAESLEEEWARAPEEDAGSAKMTEKDRVDQTKPI